MLAGAPMKVPTTGGGCLRAKAGFRAPPGLELEVDARNIPTTPSLAQLDTLATLPGLSAADHSNYSSEEGSIFDEMWSPQPAMQNPRLEAPSCPPGRWTHTRQQQGTAVAASQRSVRVEHHGEAPQEHRTTLHFRNLPCYFTRDLLMDLLSRHGFALQVDFAYVPMDFKSEGSVGYAFVNFRSGAAAKMCRESLSGFSRWPRSRKVLEVGWSTTQGWEANVQLVRNSSVMCSKVPEEFKPAVFSTSGDIAPFPGPERKVRNRALNSQVRRSAKFRDFTLRKEDAPRPLAAE